MGNKVHQPSRLNPRLIASEPHTMVSETYVDKFLDSFASIVHRKSAQPLLAERLREMLSSEIYPTLLGVRYEKGLVASQEP